MPSPSVPDADAADLVSPEGAAAPASEAPGSDGGDAGDAFAQAVGGAAPADQAPAASTGGVSEPPPPSAPDSVDPQDLAPALDAAGIDHDLGSPPGSTDAEAPQTDDAQQKTGEDARQGNAVDMALGVVRLGVGVALVAAPRWAGRIWVGPGADGPGSLVFARALGARDIALGVRILDGVRKGEPVGHWVTAGFAADAADVAATLVAGRHLTPARRVAMPLIAGAVGALGVVSARRS